MNPGLVLLRQFLKMFPRAPRCEVFSARDLEAPCLPASELPGADPVPLAAAARAGDFFGVQESKILASSDGKPAGEAAG